MIDFTMLPGENIAVTTKGFKDNDRAPSLTFTGEYLKQDSIYVHIRRYGEKLLLKNDKVCRDVDGKPVNIKDVFVEQSIPKRIIKDWVYRG